MPLPISSILNRRREGRRVHCTLGGFSPVHFESLSRPVS
jgi:hypothetical protein